MIEWTPVDVLTCFESEPTVDEESTSYRYTLTVKGLVLSLEIWPYDSDVWLAIRSADQRDPVIDLRMQGCREIRYIRDGAREELEFVSFDHRSEYPISIAGAWRLQVRPHVEVKLGHRH